MKLPFTPQTAGYCWINFWIVTFGNIKILFWIAPALLHWKLNQLHLTVHFSKCQTVTALPLIEKLNRYKMTLNNVLERRNDFEKHFWKIGYSFMAIKGRYNCKYRKSLRPCKHCPLIKIYFFKKLQWTATLILTIEKLNTFSLKISCKKVERNTQKLKIADFTM